MSQPPAASALTLNHLRYASKHEMRKFNSFTVISGHYSHLVSYLDERMESHLQVDIECVSSHYSECDAELLTVKSVTMSPSPLSSL